MKEDRMLGKIRFLSLAAGFFAVCLYACGPSPGVGNPCPDGEEPDEHGECVPIVNGDGDAGVVDPNDDGGGNNNGNVDGEVPDLWQDTSGDGVPDIYDNCPNHYNPDQADRDGDGVGDVCDNCPDHYNPDQTDSNGDGIGDACSPEPAGDLCGEILVEFEYIDPPNPNVFITVDESGSMGATDGTPYTRTERVRQGIAEMANMVADDVRLGLGGFRGSCSNPVSQYLALGQHSAATIISAANGLIASGLTPMHQAPRDIRINNRLEDPSDPLNDQRPRAFILINDGAPNACTCSEALECTSTGTCADKTACEIARLYNEYNIPTYIVGFAFSSTVFNQLAEAGNTDNPNDPDNRYFMADDGATLAAVLLAISEELIVIECNYAINPPAPSPGQVWVKFDNRWLEPHEYTYDPDTSVVSLSNAACDELHALVGGPEDNLEIVIGCPLCLPPGEECPPEWCGEDWEPHPMCEDCLPKGVRCEEDEDCCPPLECVDPSNGEFEEKVCWPPCYPVHTPCQKDDDCCPPLECRNGKCSHDGIG